MYSNTESYVLADDDGDNSLHKKYNQCLYKGMRLRADRIGNSFIKIFGNKYMRIAAIIERKSELSVFVQGNCLLHTIIINYLNTYKFHFLYHTSLKFQIHLSSH